MSCNKHGSYTLHEYHIDAVKSAIYPDAVWMSYLPLKLAGESGEVAEKFGKVFRGDKELDKADMAKELGDVLWYVSNLAGRIGYSLEDIARMNIEKLTGRAERGTLKGSGDDR